VEKAYLEPEIGGRIDCLFNPASLTITKGARWVADEVPGRAAPNLYFAGGKAATLHVTLFFDTTAEGTPVSRHTAKLLALTEIDPQLPGHDPKTGRGRPPWVRFHWSDLHSFRAVVDELTADFTFFAGDGTPLRATVDLHLRQYEVDAQFAKQNPTSGTPEPHRVHIVATGETLDRIAAAAYGDAARWRDVALANAIDDPLAVHPGTVLKLPALAGAGSQGAVGR
jgi:hypothetical protein